MSRKRILSDDQILAAAMRVMARMGPSELTLAAVGKEIGLAPATLLQRFGSKRGLMLAVASQGPAATEMQFRTALEEAKSPIAAMLDLFASCAAFLGKPEELANQLAFLQMDLSDPDFYAHLLASTKVSLIGVQRFLEAAQKARELRKCDVVRLARTINVVNQGSLLSWCVLRKGDAGTFVRRELESVLEPYLVRRK